MKRTNTQSVINFIYFTANMPSDFLLDAFRPQYILIDHLQSKLMKCIESDGKGYMTVNSFMNFMFQLDSENQTILIQWIEDNYNSGKI